ncbi:MAG: 5-bromo-4-chloroindolyl phosphate hydrolysis family protein [Candidatus Magnetoovum sp. WYHC-5]|nr:5-bromo-4-chloroindolyl phosphate hydrolysis family protein [Candidatus Magnetoovum sp. WYHC-5]
MFLFVLKLSPILSIIVAILAYVAIDLIFSQRKKQQIEVTLKKVQNEEVDKVIREATKKIDTIGSYITKIKKVEIKDKVSEICLVGRNVIKEIQRDPKDVRVAKQFLSYYLDATVYIVEKYAELAAVGLSSGDINKRLSKVEGMLDTIKNTFIKQHERLLDNDLMDLDVEMDLLEKTIKIEGL